MRQQNADSQLIGRMQAGDGTAVAELASTYGPRIHQLALRYVKNWEDAEEVTQDVIMKVFGRSTRFAAKPRSRSGYPITFKPAMSRLRSTRVVARPNCRSRMSLSEQPDRAVRARNGRRSPTIRCFGSNA